jgi:hypothetical protein
MGKTGDLLPSLFPTFSANRQAGHFNPSIQIEVLASKESIL